MINKIKIKIHKASVGEGEKDENLEKFFKETHTSYTVEEAGNRRKGYHYYVPFPESEFYTFIKTINEYYNNRGVVFYEYFDEDLKETITGLMIYDDYIE